MAGDADLTISGVITAPRAAGWRPVAPRLAMTAVIRVEDEGGPTRYLAGALHLRAEDAHRHADMGFGAGFAMAINPLGAVPGRRITRRRPSRES